MDAALVFTLAYGGAGLALFLIVLLSRRARRHGGALRAGIVGATYEWQNRDKQRALDLIVEGKAAENDPEFAEGDLPQLESHEPEGQRARRTMYYLLFYDYVEDILDRRAPFREAHLCRAREALERGELLMAGAFTEPVDGATFVFRVEDPAIVEDFVKHDPYVEGGLVTSWRIRPWNVVVEAQPSTP